MNEPNEIDKQDLYLPYRKENQRDHVDFQVVGENYV